ncbi:MAG: aminotransferase class I/II-fold pyridoxal phosphate-dependent enzyme [Fusobacteriaceae bacterium]|nr:aminotransferase class I/II-fold pyridoxal phosphate-dependent enzyme [Fusobacteriaceae bacterium]MBP6467128.1 aminotransferase class I/II-fold pyridoxal phosphate-dependent enzyme [Fusobacteriaceae bacterium]MBP9597189.1 aminotransferase class I/II-fold pyridoxal phosphate-dependent enzyme [Fusobacteriaceae bacterium]MBU9919149.1 aminotransferase class I/II-fold pyridoxal phosphate-dependent enzyme [Fusobacteriaceae bacterium]
MNDRISDKLKVLKPSGIRKFFDIVATKKDVISLGVGEPDFATPWNIVDAAFYNMKMGRTHYTSNFGLLEFRKEVGEYLKKYDLDYGPDEIIATIGGSEGIDLALRSIINPGDEIIVPEPVYVPYRPLSELTGATVVGIDTSKTEFKVDAKELEKLITPKTKAIILCYPNNPTGITMPYEDLKAVAEVVKKHNVWVITDEIYSELTYVGDHTSIASFPGMKERTIYLNGFSKAFAMTGWRIGYICGPKELIQQMVKIHQYTTLCAPIISQYGAIEALKNSIPDMLSMRDSFARRRRLIFEGFKGLGMEIVEPKGALYVFPSIEKYGLSGEEFAIRLLEEENVAVVPGDAFGEGFEKYIRCSYATSIEQIKESIVRIGRFVKRLEEEKKFLEK